MASHLQREREFREGTVLRSFPDAILVTDAAGRVTFMNPEAERLTAWREDEALGQPAEELLRVREPVDGPARQGVVERALGLHEVIRFVDGDTTDRMARITVRTTA